MERNQRAGAINPWSTRHTAIYCNVNRSGTQSIILVNPSENSTFEQKVLGLRLEDEIQAKLYQEGLDNLKILLLLLLETHLYTWKDYLADRWDAYEEAVSWIFIKHTFMLRSLLTPIDRTKKSQASN